MPAKITIKFPGKSIKLENFRMNLPRNVQSGLNKIGALFIKRVKTRKLLGQVLNRITGFLSRSMGYRVHIDSMTSWHVKVGTVHHPVSYAAIHEYGGKCGRNHSVKHKGKYYMRGTLKELRPRIVRILQTSIMRPIK